MVYAPPIRFLAFFALISFLAVPAPAQTATAFVAFINAYESGPVDVLATRSTPLRGEWWQTVLDDSQYRETTDWLGVNLAPHRTRNLPMAVVRDGDSTRQEVRYEDDMLYHIWVVSDSMRNPAFVVRDGAIHHIPDGERTGQMHFYVANFVRGKTIDVRLRDALDSNNVSDTLLWQGTWGELTPYSQHPSGEVNFEVVASDGTREAFYLNSTKNFNFGGYAFVVILANDAGTGVKASVLSYDSGRFVYEDLAISTGVRTSELPSTLVLHGNYPNPFNPSTQIIFDLSSAAHVAVDVFDLLGRQVMTVPPRAHAAGSRRTIPLETTGLASGVYLYRLTATGPTFHAARHGRMTLTQ